MKREALFAWLRKYRSVSVAFSGGVDSSVLWAAAVRAVGAQNVWALTACSATFPQVQRQALTTLISSWGMRHVWVPTLEMEDADFQRNDRRRCYYCKRILFRELRCVAENLGTAVLVEGSNADDALAYRPGA